MVRWGMSRQAILRALEDDGFASAQETAVIRTRRIEDLMAAAGLTERVAERYVPVSLSPVVHHGS